MVRVLDNSMNYIYSVMKALVIKLLQNAFAMKKTISTFLVFLCLFYSGSVMAGTAENTSSESIQTEYARTLDNLSREEQKWFKTFQEGTFLIDGWQSITEELLASTPEHLREHQKQRLDQLGLKIGLEWSRDNDIRRVDNRMLQEWGKTLKKTARKNPEQLSEVIVSIDQAVNNILN